MATHAGSEGTVKIGTNVIAEVRSWSIEETGETADSTSFDNARNQSGGLWATHKHTISRWSGTLEAFWDDTDTTGQLTMQSGASVELNVFPEGDESGDVYYTGMATITSINRSAAVDGLVEANFNFEGNGALEQTSIT